MAFFTMLLNGGLVTTYIKDTFWELLLPGLVTSGFNVLFMKSYFTCAICFDLNQEDYVRRISILAQRMLRPIDWMGQHPCYCNPEIHSLVIT